MRALYSAWPWLEGCTQQERGVLMHAKPLTNRHDDVRQRLPANSLACCAVLMRSGWPAHTAEIPALHMLLL